MASSSTYLKQRKLGWYVQIAVPKDLQAILQCKTITRSLNTRDEVEAHKRKHGVIAEIQSTLRQATAVAPSPTPATPEGLLRAALAERAAVFEDGKSPQEAEAALDSALDDFLEKQAAIHGIDAEGRPKLPPEAEGLVKRAIKAVRGRPELSLSHNTQAYLKEQERRLTAQTIGDKRRRLDAFLEWFGGERECSEVTRRVAGTYVAEVIHKRTQKDAKGKTMPLSATTLGKEVSDLRSFFDWLERRGRIEPGSNPFYRMAATVKGSSRGRAPERRPWKPAELAKVLQGVSPSDPLWALTAIGAYTGMRREEVAGLRVDAVEGNMFLVEEGKSVAATRRVPIHSAIAPLVKSLAKHSTDGYLIPGLLPGGPDGKRGWLIGKRFGHTIRKLGIDDPKLDFHALRGTVITQMEEAQVPLPTIQLIVGHERQGVTLRSYSGGVSDKVKLAALQKVTFGSLDNVVAKTGAKVIVKESARARRK